MGGLVRLDDWIAKSATPVGAKTRGGYEVVMSGGQRRYRKESKGPEPKGLDFSGFDDAKLKQLQAAVQAELDRRSKRH